MAKGRIGRSVWIFAALAVLGAATVALAGLADLQPVTGSRSAAIGAERSTQPIRVTIVTFASVKEVQSYTGVIRPQHEVALGFRLAGKLLERRVEVGDRVIAGQVLALLDDSDARLELEIAQAEAEAARIDLVRTQAEVARSRALFAEGHVTQAVLDRVLSAEGEATARSDRAVRAHNLAANRLSYTRLVATSDGIVTATPVEAGQVVAEGQPILSLALGRAVDVVFALPEQERAFLDGAVARAELWGLDGAGFDLRLRDVAPDVDPAGRTYRVRMELIDPPAEASLGRTVTVRLVRPDPAPAVPVPLAAVFNDGSGPAVWRLTADLDQVERVAVNLVAVGAEVARLHGALVEGDLIVSLGAHKIDPARSVRVVETAPTPAG